MSVLSFFVSQLVEEGIQCLTDVPIWIHSLLEKIGQWFSMYLTAHLFYTVALSNGTQWYEDFCSSIFMHFVYWDDSEGKTTIL
jgi:hypothetical protein